MRRARFVPALLLIALLALVAGDGDWWQRDWWRGALRTTIDDWWRPAPLARISGPQCLRALAASGAAYVRVADFATAQGCRVDAAVRVTALDRVALSSPFLAACPLALALQRHVALTARPAARELLGSELARIDHLGSFACRRVRGRPAGPLSEHAFARALDVTGYATADGREISLAGHWRAPDDSAERRFLRRISARRLPFSTVITPDDDRLHHDHFHLGLRPPR
jgi:hypothetical protein